MSKIFDTVTKRDISISTALKNGLIKNPARFIIPRDKVIIPVKGGREIVTVAKATKLLKAGKIKLSQVLGSYDLIQPDIIILGAVTSPTVKKPNITKTEKKAIKNQFGSGLVRYVLTPDDKKDAYAFYNFLKNNNISGKGKFIVAQNGRVLTEINRHTINTGTKDNPTLVEIDLDITLPLSKWWKDNNGHLIGMIDSDRHAWIYSDDFNKRGPKDIRETPYIMGKDDNNNRVYVVDDTLNKTNQKRLLAANKKTVTVFYWSPSVNVPSTKLYQTFRLASGNTCFLDVIESFLNGKLENDNGKSKAGYAGKLEKLQAYRAIYPDGIPEGDDIQKLANDLKLNFEINDVLNNNVLSYKSNSKKTSGGLTVRFMNSRFNHVDKNEFVTADSNNEIEVKDRKIMTAKIDELTGVEPFYYIGTHNEPSKIFTKDGTYIYKSEINDIIHAFNKLKGIYDFALDYKNDYDKCRFIHYGVNYNAHCAFSNFHEYTTEHIEKSGKFTEYDMKEAYTQYEQYKHYVGFPTYMTPTIKLENWTVDKCRDHVGYYLVKVVKITKKNTKLIMEDMGFIKNSEYVLTTPEILLFNEFGVKFEFILASYTFKTKHIDMVFFDGPMKKKIPTQKFGKWITQKPYAIWAGKLNRIQKTETRKTITNFDMAQVLSHQYKSVTINPRYNNKTNDEYSYDNVECKIEFDKKSVQWLGHIGGFITAYTRCIVLDSLLRVKYNQLIGFKLDGFIMKGKAQHIEADILERGDDNILWTNSKKVKCNFNWGNGIYSPCLDAAEGYNTSTYDLDNDRINNDANNIYKHSGLPQQLFNKRVSILQGPGGTGKSHAILNTLRDTLYICASWKLITEKVQEYPGLRGITYHQLLGLGCDSYIKTHRHPTRVFVDEITQIDKKIIARIIKALPHTQIFLAGDVDEFGYYQCSFKEVQVIKDFKDMEIIKFTKNYRCKDDELLKRLTELRHVMQNTKFNNTTIKMFVRHAFKDRKITEEELKKTYDYKTDWVLCSTTNKDNCKEKPQTTHYTEILTGEKYLCIRHERNHIYKKLAGEKNVYLKGDIVCGPPPNKRFEKRHAYTIHSFQGVTIKSPSRLFIDTNNIFDPRQLYTAISRVERLDQIYII